MANPEPLVQRLRLDPDQGISALQRMQGALRSWVGKTRDANTQGKKLEGSLKSIGKSAKTWIAGVAVAAFTALAAAATKAFANAAEFQEQMGGVRKTAALTADEVGGLTERLLDIESELGTPRRELAQIAEEAGRLGLSGVDNIATFTRTVSMLATSTTASASQATSGLAKITNSFQLPIDQAEELSSMLNTLSNQTVATVSDLIDSMVRVGSSAQNVNLAAEEVAAMSATMIDMGISSRETGTALRNMFNRMNARAAKLGEQMGMTSDQIVQAFEEDGLDALHMWLDSLRELDQVSQANAIQEIVGQGVSMQVVQQMVGQTDAMAQNIEDAAGQMEHATSIQREMTRHQKGFNRQWDLFATRVGSFLTSQGAGMLDWAESVLTTINQWAGDSGQSIREMDLSFVELQDMVDLREQINQIRELEESSRSMERAVSGLPDALQGFADFDPVTDTAIAFDVDAALRQVDRQIARKQREFDEERLDLIERQRELAVEIGRTEAQVARLQEAGLTSAAAEKNQELRNLQRERVEIVEAMLAPLDQTQDLNTGVVRDALSRSAEQANVLRRPFFERQIDSAEELLRMYRRIKEAGEQAQESTTEPTQVGTPTPGPGSEETDRGPQVEFSSGIQPAALDEAYSLLEQIQQASQDLFNEEKNLAAIDKITDRYSNAINRLRIQQEEGTITQREFSQQATEAAQRYREDMLALVEQWRNLGILTPRVADRVVAALNEMEDGTDPSRLISLGETLQSIGGLAGGIMDVADAFTDMSDEARQAMRGVTRLLEQSGRLSELAGEAGGFGELFSSAGGAASGIGAIAGIVGGVAQVGAALFGGPDRSDRIAKLQSSIGENVNALERNTQALFENARVGNDIAPNEMDALRETMNMLTNYDQFSELSGEQVDRRVDRMENMFPFMEGANELRGDAESFFEEHAFRDLQGRQLLSDEYMQDLARQFVFGDLTAEEAQQQALDTLAANGMSGPFTGGFTPEDLNRAFGEEFVSFGDIFDRLQNEFGAFGDSMAGLIAEVQFREKHLGASLEDLTSVIQDRITDVGLDQDLGNALSDAIANADDVDTFTTELAEALAQDQDLGFLGLGGGLEEALGDVSPGEMEDFIDLLRGLGDQSGGASSDVRTTTQVQNTITEWQANELLTYQQEQVLTQRVMSSQLAAINAALGGKRVSTPIKESSSTREATGGQSGGSSTVVQAQFDVTASMSAEETARKLQEAIDLIN